MSETVLIYKSQYGSAKKYAQWISKELGCELYEVSQVKKPEDLLNYGTIIFGGGLYAGGINGVSLLTKNFQKIKDRNLVVFTVGLASTADTSIFEPILRKNFTQEMRERIRFFHLRGGIDYKKLGLAHKSMMAMMKAVTERKEAKTEEDRLMLATYGDKIDFSDEPAIAPLIACVRSLNGCA